MFKRFLITVSIIMGISFLGIAITLPLAVGDGVNFYNTAVSQAETSKKTVELGSDIKTIAPIMGYNTMMEIRQSQDSKIKVEYFDGSVCKNTVDVKTEGDKAHIYTSYVQNMPKVNLSVSRMITWMVEEGISSRVILYIPQDITLDFAQANGRISYKSSLMFANKQEVEQQNSQEETENTWRRVQNRLSEYDQKELNIRSQIEKIKANYAAQTGDFSTYGELISVLTDPYYNSLFEGEVAQIRLIKEYYPDFDGVAATELKRQILDVQKKQDCYSAEKEKAENQFHQGEIAQTDYDSKMTVISQQQTDLQNQLNVLKEQFQISVGDYYNTVL